ncbi:MAG: dihydrofolate synthase / folylpolyglutamate synthase [Solirubrobacteraceae bacterium]|nr:dihydrofolate synthase / folylpolyglutamate synthase [Solirubrobacteraceae bacterium]
MTAPAAAGKDAWSLDDAERYLLSLELFGMRFGLDRIRRLLTALGSPQEGFESIHVVGTNGKSSTVRMIATILERHGVRTGAYLSPHLVSFAERVRVDDREVDGNALAGAVARAARAAQLVERNLPDDDRVTQFEALTAAAYFELAQEGVEVAVVEAGLGGRFDATNVIESRVQVLTNVGLEHSRWLGPTIADIAREKLAVVRPSGTLVVGADLHPDAAREAVATCERLGARLVIAPADAGVELRARGSYQRRNFAVAVAAARAFLGDLDDAAVADTAATVEVAGRFQTVGERPLTILDGAHNPAGFAALVDALDELPEGAPLVAVVSILDDKDAPGMLAALLPRATRCVYTASTSPRALSPATLASLGEQLGGPPADLEPDPHRALALARELAGPDGVVLATGSIYLVADLLAAPGERTRSTL